MSLFGGSASQTAFGASSGDILTKTTAILVVLFMLSGIGMAFLKKQDSSLQKVQEKMMENPDSETEEGKTDSTLPQNNESTNSPEQPPEGAVEKTATQPK